MATLSENLKFLMHKANINVTTLARKTGVNQSALHKMVSGKTYNPNVLSLSPIAKFFSVSISQLIGDEHLFSEAFTDAHQTIKLPLIEWVQCVDWENKHKFILPKQSVQTDKKVSDSAFALRITDEINISITFTKGSIIVVDPKEKLRNGDYVIVSKNNGAFPVIKRIIIEMDDIYLKSINEGIKLIQLNSDYKIIGVIVQLRSDFN